MKRDLILILIFTMCFFSASAGAGVSNTKIQVIKVSNYKEFAKAIGSNRQIELLPGNYNPKAYGMEGQKIKSVSNLTITGKGDTKSKRKNTDFNVTGTESIFSFENCKKVEISNLNLGFSKVKDENGCVVCFDNCTDITVKNCNLYGNGEAFPRMMLNNVKSLTCSNSNIDSSNFAVLKINFSENIQFKSCTLKGYTIELDDDILDEPNKKLLFNNCNLLGKSVIRSTWSGFMPVKDSCGYEVSLGTEGWNEWRLLSAIKYASRKLSVSNLTYINTYDGNEEIFNDGKFLKLADKLSNLTKGKVIPSIDYIVDKEDSYNDTFDGKPKLKKLNINIAESDLSKANIESMFKSIKLLKPLAKDISSYSWPVTIVYRDAANPFSIIATAEFSSDSFKEYLENGNDNNLEKYCSIFLTDRTNINATSFFNIKIKDSADLITKRIGDLFITKTIKTEEDFGQRNSIVFTSKGADGYYYVSALQSFSGMGDYVHYNTDMIIKTNAVSGEQYISANDNTYKLLNNSEYQSKYRQVILNELKSNPNVTKLISGSPVNDVLVFVENNSDQSLNFIFLVALKIDSFDGDYIQPRYTFKYYLGTFDLKKNKVTGVRGIELVDFAKMLR